MKIESYVKKLVDKDSGFRSAMAKHDFDFEMSHLITVARLHAGLTQVQLAKKIGTKQPSIARAESGGRLPTIPFLKKIAKAVGAELIAPKFSFSQNPRIVTVTSSVTVGPGGYKVSDEYFGQKVLESETKNSQATFDFKKDTLNYKKI